MRKKAFTKQQFPRIRAVCYEGPKTDNPLAFRRYNPDEIIDGTTLKDHLRLSIGYWHSFRGAGLDPFRAPTINRP